MPVLPIPDLLDAPCCCADADDADDGRTWSLSRRSLLRGLGAGGLALAAGATLPPLSALAATGPDIYNPFTAYPITGTWAQHIARKSAGGVDFGMSVGTPLPACGAGTITNLANNGSAGNTVTLALGGGWKSQYFHLSRFTTSGRTVAKKAVIGYSGGAAGAPGSGSSTGPHCHWHLINPSGVRVNALNYVSDTGGAPGLPKTATEDDGEPGPVFYKRMQNWLRITEGYTGPIDGDPGTNTYKALQSAMRAYAYTGPVDGVMGTNSWKAVQRLAAKWGYDGPIDGAMGANSWRGFAKFLNQDKWD